jgi:hypothetical protein
MSETRDEGVCELCGHKHARRCRHRLDPHFYEHRADAPICGCPAALLVPRASTPTERPT